LPREIILIMVNHKDTSKKEFKIINNNLNNLINRDSRSTSRNRISGDSQPSRSITSSISSNLARRQYLSSKANTQLNKSNLHQIEKEVNNSDATDSEVDENDRLLNNRLKNKVKTQFLECRSLFSWKN
jgi:hypothetical protein